VKSWRPAKILTVAIGLGLLVVNDGTNALDEFRS
jgi:hypothetical protein